MKLLTPKEHTDLRGQELSRELLRTQEIKNLAKREESNLAKAQMEFSQMMAGQQARWAMEEDEHTKRKLEMQREIDKMEQQKLNALVPFDILKVGTDEKMEETATFIAKLRIREENVEDLTERLQDKLDEVGEKEQDLKKLDRKLQFERIGIENQKQTTSDNAKALSEEMKSFAIKRAEEEKDIKERKEALFLQDTNLNALQGRLEAKERELDKFAIRLRDERGVLDRAFQEVERMKLKYK